MSAENELSVDELRRTLTQRTVDNVLNGTRWLSERELKEVRNIQTRSPSRTITRWVDSKRVLALDIDGARKIPAYALDDRREPLPILRAVLKILADRTPLSIAAWFESPSTYLNGRRPRELLATDGLAVVKAAEKTEQSRQGPCHG